ncbi:MAG: response regulator [Clostridia bacterium]|nr:response regulator [Clostridia bacterium]
MRHNLLIVDDEILIRQGLMARLAYLNIKTDEIYEASNGTEALDIVKAAPIDVVITDIRMPDMDGLTFIQKAKEYQNEIQFVVLSGYAEFSYAETAIRLGVKAFLLKPLSNEELKKTLEKLFEEREGQQQIKEKVKKVFKLSKEQEKYQMEKTINSYIANLHHEAAPAEVLWEKSGFCDSEKYKEDICVALVVVRMEEKSFHNEFEEKDHDLMRFTIKNVMDELECECEKVIVNCFSDYNKLYALFFSDNSRKMKNEIARVFLRMQSVLEEKIGIFISFGVSRIKNELTDHSLRETSSALKQRIIYGDSNLYFYEDVKLFSEKKFPAVQMNLFDQYVERKDMDKLRGLLGEIFSDELVKTYGTAYLRIMWMRVINSIFHHLDKIENKSPKIEKLIMNLNFPDEIQSITEIREKIWNIVEECAQTEETLFASAKSRVQAAVSYIEDHYNENISVNDLAERFGMSPNYFSSIFKKEMKQSAVNYLTRIRLKQAERLLGESDMNVVDIARQVGYEDGQYFFRVFKKHTGMTPLKYREIEQHK